MSQALAAEPRLELRVERAAGPRSAGMVVVVGPADRALRLYRQGNSWGDEMLGFEASGPAGTVRIARAPQTYTRNVPATTELAPGAVLDLPFDLADGTWEPSLPSDAAALTAVLEIPNSPESDAHEVWTGTVRSAPAPLD